jgi:hypothetical protein
MSKSQTIDNIINEVSEVFDEMEIGHFDEDMEMTVLVHAQKMARGGYGKKIRDLQKLDKDFNISSKHSQHKSKSKGKSWKD